MTTTDEPAGGRPAETPRQRRPAITPARIVQAEQRRAIAGLYLQGLTQAEIGQRLGLHQSNVSRWLCKIERDWMREAADDLAAARLRELERVDALERQAWAAWERSCRPKRDRRARRAERPAAGGQMAPAGGAQEVRTVERDGDPKFLLVINQCIGRRMQLLGLDRQTLDVHMRGPAVKVYLGIDPEAV